MASEEENRESRQIDWSVLSGSYVSRRTLLKLMALASAAGITAACAPNAAPTAAPPTSAPATNIAPTAAAAATAAPTQAAPSGAPKAGGTVRIINSGGGTNPIIDNEVLIWSIFDALVQQDINADIHPGLAERWDVTPDGTVFTFFLRNDAKWTDGQAIDADDVIFTFNKVMDPDVQAWGRRWFGTVLDKWEALDKYTVKFTMKQPAAPLLDHFAEQRIAPEHIMGKLSAKELNEGDLRRNAPVSSGPFKFVQLVPDTVVITQRNDSYYMPRGSNDYRYVPWIKQLEFHFWGDPNVNLLKMETGERDAHVLTMTRPEHDRLAQNPNINIQVFPVGIYNYIYMNNENLLFSDKRVRQAIAYAIDKKTIVDTVLGPIGQVQDSFLDPADWAYKPDVKKYEFDPAKAKQLLAEAGWTAGSDGVLTKDGARFEFEAWAQPQNEVAEPIQSYLKDVGIVMKIRPIDWPAIVDELAKPNFVAAEQNDGYEAYPDRRHRWHSSNVPPKGVNVARYKNPELDKILDEAWATTDRAKLKELYWKMQDILVEDLPWVPIFYPLMVQATSKRLNGTEPGALYFVQTACKWWVSDATDPEKA
ncbi:MAG TPA: ABC transporter substrate-binding protein [Anaerolineae bacterium]|nr:ABC transporter substrate-binding protein [Anaerolineae bacterium]